MHFKNKVPVLILHLLERDVSQNPSIVNQNIYTLEMVDCSLDDLVSELDGVVVGHCFSAFGLNLGDHLIGRVVATAHACVRSAQVVDHHFSPSAREEESVLSADASACACNDHYLSVES